MVFHEIDTITDVNIGHRIILYYIENKYIDKPNLCKTLESAIGMLEKKNDDLLIIRVLYDSAQFEQFQELYKAEISGTVTLFAVNNKGIPVTSQHISKEENISLVLESLCDTCKLNKIPEIKIVKPKTNLKLVTNSTVQCSAEASTAKQASSNSLQLDPQKVTKNSPLGLSETDCLERPPQSPFTLLQIRLPDGSRDTQKFDKDAVLDEVRSFVSTKYKLKDFDLKIYDHQTFSENEYGKTLKDLDLYPNGVIIVLPKNCASFNQNGGIGPMVRYGWYHLVTNVTYTFNYIQGLLIMFWNSFFTSRNNTNSSKGRNQTGSEGRNDGQSTSQNRSSNSSTKSSGNIHTLRRNDDSDEENNRYNGNSTQQK